jgi:WD domain, G-beta repeat
MLLRVRILLPLVLVAAAGIALALLGRDRFASAGRSVPVADPDEPAAVFPDPAGRTVLPASMCLAPARPAPRGPSPRCVIPFERAIAATGVAPGGHLAVASLTHAATAGWALPEGSLRVSFDPLPAEAEARVILLRDGAGEALLAVGHRLVRYDTGSGRVLRWDDGPGGMIADLAWARDGALAAIAGGRAHVLGSDDGGWRVLAIEGGAVKVALDARGRRVAVGTDAGSISLFDLTDGGDAPAVTVAPSLQPPAVLAFESDRLLVAGTDGALRALDPATGRELARADVGAPLVALAVSPDGRRIATAARDRVIRVHAPTDLAVVAELGWHEANVDFVGFGAGPTLVSTDRDGNLALWDAADLGG